MPSPLVIPGVQVRTLFEPSPVLPGATGILGVVGVTDRGPLEPTPIGNMGELVDTFGPATRFTMPEVRTALANGVSQVVVARTAPGSSTASLKLVDDEGEDVVILRSRAEGTWGSLLSVRVTQVKGAAGGVKYINLEVFYAGVSIETFNRLVMDEESPDYLFTRINQGSRVLVATDPAFDAELPAAKIATAFEANTDAVAAIVQLKSGAADVGLVRARRQGRAGNQSVVKVLDAAPGLALKDGDGQPSVDIRRREGVDKAVSISVSAPGGDGKSTLNIFKADSASRAIPFEATDALIDLLKNDPDVVADKKGAGKPAALVQTPLARRIDIEVSTEGRESRHYRNLSESAAIKPIDDPVVEFGDATKLPDAGAYPLTGGRNKGPALLLKGDVAPDPLVELIPASDQSKDVLISIARPAGGTAVIQVLRGGDVLETFADLTMDPDDPNYLISALEASAHLRARDLFVRVHGENFPAGIARPRALAGGSAPTVDAYRDALDRLESAEEVDLVIASVANQLDDANAREVQKAVVAHCTKMADVARNRIGLGSIGVGENRDINKILDHADDVRSDHFILTAPAGSEAAVAGLLGRQDYFESPTFKTVASVDAPLVSYTDAQLTRLVPANLAVVTKKRKVGVIVVKGLLTSGRQINVQRTANKSVRDVKAIADKYIGLLNNDGSRNALRQQVIAMFLQMQNDGAIVPSTDGQDPAFKVDVYSSQADFANGIVRIDIAVRPVRAIDYVYATILVKN